MKLFLLFSLIAAEAFSQRLNFPQDFFDKKSQNIMKEKNASGSGNGGYSRAHELADLSIKEAVSELEVISKEDFEHFFPKIDYREFVRIIEDTKQLIKSKPLYRDGKLLVYNYFVDDEGKKQIAILSPFYNQTEVSIDIESRRNVKRRLYHEASHHYGFNDEKAKQFSTSLENILVYLRVKDEVNEAGYALYTVPKEIMGCVPQREAVLYAIKTYNDVMAYHLERGSLFYDGKFKKIESPIEVFENIDFQSRYGYSLKVSLPLETLLDVARYMTSLPLFKKFNRISKKADPWVARLFYGSGFRNNLRKDNGKHVKRLTKDDHSSDVWKMSVGEVFCQGV